MKPRRPSIQHFLASTILAIQQDRLLGILRGEIKPDCARERLFVKKTRGARHIRLGDYILPAELFLNERRIFGDGPGGAF
jgi:hypothetical protein